jgi:hypothetical protein
MVVVCWMEQQAELMGRFQFFGWRFDGVLHKSQHAAETSIKWDMQKHKEKRRRS